MAGEVNRVGSRVAFEKSRERRDELRGVYEGGASRAREINKASLPRERGEFMLQKLPPLTREARWECSLSWLAWSFAVPGRTQPEAHPARRPFRQFLAVDVELVQRPRPAPGALFHEVHDEQ